MARPVEKTRRIRASILVALSGQEIKKIRSNFGMQNVRSVNIVNRRHQWHGTTCLKPCFEDRKRVQQESHSNPRSRTSEQVTLVGELGQDALGILFLPNRWNSKIGGSRQYGAQVGQASEVESYSRDISS